MKLFPLPLMPTLMSVPAICVLVALGFWQLNRLEFKENYLAQLANRMDLAPIDLPVYNVKALNALDQEKWEFMPVTLKGTYLHDQEIHILQRALNGEEGLNIYTPFAVERPDNAQEITENPLIILVNRGFVPFEYKSPSSRLDTQFQGVQSVTGLVRFNHSVRGVRKMVLPEPDLVQNLWYGLDIDQINDLLKDRLSTRLPKIFILNRDQTDQYPQGRQWKVNVHNDHLQYAITWFLLALGLIGVYSVYVYNWRKA